jgi:hypothetical protein
MDTAADTSMGGEGAAHFCKAPTDEEVQSWRQHWQAEYDAAHPPIPAPPMGNRTLALDLTGDGIRDFPFQGVTYRLKPTPYRTAILLQDVREQLNTLAAIGEITGEASLLELRECYAAIAELGGALLTPHLSANPFLADGGQDDLHRLLVFLLDSGDMMPNRPGNGQPVRVNAAHELMAYWAVYGEPTTWRRFRAGCACISRLEADRSLEMYYVVTVAGWGSKEAREELVANLKRAAGR